MAETVQQEVKQVEITIGETTHTVDERVAEYIKALETDFENAKGRVLELEARAGKSVKDEIEKFRAALQSSNQTVHDLIDRLLKHLGL